MAGLISRRSVSSLSFVRNNAPSIASGLRNKVVSVASQSAITPFPASAASHAHSTSPFLPRASPLSATATFSKTALTAVPATNTFRVHSTHSHLRTTSQFNTEDDLQLVNPHHATPLSTAHVAPSAQSTTSPSATPIYSFPCEKSAIELLYALHAAPQCERAFYVHDLGIVERQYTRWCSELPRVKPFYAVKCNPDPVLVKSLASFGASFDCASGAEIAAVLETGTPANEIIFANPIKNYRDLQYARKVGVNKMTFDNVDELYKIAQHHPEAEVVLRLLPDDSGSLMRFGVKFGAPTPNIPKILATVKQLGLKMIGCSFHIGSGCFNPNKYYEAIQLASSVFQQAEAMGLPKLSLLDLGGGFPGNPVPHARTPAEGGHLTPAFEEFAAVIRRALDDFFPAGCGVDIIAEPGRYMATAWSTLFTLIQGKREEPVPQNTTKKFLYYINDGVYGSFNCLMFDHAHPVPVPASRFMNDKISVVQLEQQKLQQQQQHMQLKLRSSSSSNKKLQPLQSALSMSVTSSSQTVAAPAEFAHQLQHARAASSSSSSSSSSTPVCYGTFFGPTCDSMDVIAKDFPLSDELCVGDWLAFEQFGAYTSAAATTFNGMEKPDHYYVKSARPSPSRSH